MGIQGDWSSWRGRGAAPIVGVWGQSHHKTKVQDKLAIGNNAKPLKTNEKIEDLRVNVTQINYDLY
ncbi:MAG: hypothetical protein PUB37_03625, partial [Firmicutes bacterium]|nr:hypothetical protein [Bacillota bacterium]